MLSIIILGYLIIGLIVSIIARINIFYDPKDKSYTTKQLVKKIMKELISVLAFSIVWPFVFCLLVDDYCSKKMEKTPLLDKGNGMTARTPVDLTCASLVAANVFIDNFISEHHGKQGVDWQRCSEGTLGEAAAPRVPIAAIPIRLADGREINYYFNIWAPLVETMKLLTEYARTGQEDALRELGSSFTEENSKLYLSQQFADLKTLAREGDKKIQDYLRDQGITW